MSKFTSPLIHPHVQWHPEDTLEICPAIVDVRAPRKKPQLEAVLREGTPPLIHPHTEWHPEDLLEICANIKVVRGEPKEEPNTVEEISLRIMSGGRQERPRQRPPYLQLVIGGG